MALVFYIAFDMCCIFFKIDDLFNLTLQIWQIHAVKLKLFWKTNISLSTSEIKAEKYYHGLNILILNIVPPAMYGLFHILTSI